MISDSVKEIQLAYNELKKLSKDEKSREKYEERLKWLRDYASAIDSKYTEGWNNGKIEGKTEGKIEGERAKAVDIALGMLKDGLAIEKISQYTSLSIEEIEKLTKINKL